MSYVLVIDDLCVWNIFEVIAEYEHVWGNDLEFKQSVYRLGRAERFRPPLREWHQPKPYYPRQINIKGRYGSGREPEVNCEDVAKVFRTEKDMKSFSEQLHAFEEMIQNTRDQMMIGVKLLS